MRDSVITAGGRPNDPTTKPLFMPHRSVARYPLHIYEPSMTALMVNEVGALRRRPFLPVLQHRDGHAGFAYVPAVDVKPRRRTRLSVNLNPSSPSPLVDDDGSISR